MKYNNKWINYKYSRGKLSKALKMKIVYQALKISYQLHKAIQAITFSFEEYIYFSFFLFWI